jgi:hypothetical protein
VEVLVHAAAREPVEPLDRVAQPGEEVLRELHAPGAARQRGEPLAHPVDELLERVAAQEVLRVLAERRDEVAGLVVHRGVPAGEALPGARVQDGELQEVRVLGARRVPTEVRLGAVVVGRLLVARPAAVPVHAEDAVADEREVRDERRILVECLLEDDRRAPRRVHVQERDPERLGDRDDVALARPRRAAADVHAVEVLARPAAAVREAAAREHDAPIGADADLPAAVPGLHAHDAAGGVGDHALHAVLGQQRPAVARDPGEQPRDRHAAHDDLPVVVDGEDHAPEPPLVLGQLVVARPVGLMADPHRAELLQPLQRRRGVVVVRADEQVLPLREAEGRVGGVVEERPADAGEEPDEVLARVLLAEGAEEVVVRDHHPARGLGARPPAVGGLLDHDDRQALVEAVDGGRAAGDAGADDHDVGGVVPVRDVVRVDDGVR